MNLKANRWENSREITKCPQRRHNKLSKGRNGKSESKTNGCRRGLGLSEIQDPVFMTHTLCCVLKADPLDERMSMLIPHSFIGPMGNRQRAQCGI